MPQREYLKALLPQYLFRTESRKKPWQDIEDWWVLFWWLKHIGRPRFALSAALCGQWHSFYHCVFIRYRNGFKRLKIYICIYQDFIRVQTFSLNIGGFTKIWYLEITSIVCRQPPDSGGQQYWGKKQHNNEYAATRCIFTFKEKHNPFGNFFTQYSTGKQFISVSLALEWKVALDTCWFSIHLDSKFKSI